MRQEYLSFTDTAKVLKKSRATIYRYMQEGLLKPYYTPAKHNLPCFARKQVESLQQLSPVGPRQDNAKILKQAKIRDGYRCAICFHNTAVVAHHVIPLEVGGPDTLENLITLCTGCHRSVHYPNMTILLRKARKYGTLAIAHWLLISCRHKLPREEARKQLPLLC